MAPPVRRKKSANGKIPEGAVIHLEELPDGRKLLHYDVRDVPDLPFGHEHAEPSEPGGGPRVELPDELERFRFYDLQQLATIPPTRWLIKDKLAAGELTGLYGKGDSYKSFIALDWAMTLAAAGQTVVYIVAEGASGIRARTEAWKKTRGIEGDLPGMFFMPSNVNLHLPGAADEWVEACQLQLGDRKPSLVVIDTLARNFVGGSENDAKDMGQFVEGCERIRVGLGAAVVVIHHTDKEGKSERGTESLRNASFAMFKVTKLGGGANGGWAAKVECDRIKEAVPPEPEQIGLRHVLLPELSGEGGEPVSSLAPVTYNTVEPAPDSSADSSARTNRAVSSAQAELLRWMRTNPRTNRLAIQKGLKWGKSKASETANSLVELGKLRPEGTTRNREYVLVEDE